MKKTFVFSTESILSKTGIIAAALFVAGSTYAAAQSTPDYWQASAGWGIVHVVTNSEPTVLWTGRPRLGIGS